MTGLLLGADPQVRSWISFYIRNGQKKHNESLAAFRTKLLDQLKNLIMEAKEYQQRDGAISQVFLKFFLSKLVESLNLHSTWKQKLLFGEKNWSF